MTSCLSCGDPIGLWEEVPPIARADDVSSAARDRSAMPERAPRTSQVPACDACLRGRFPGCRPLNCRGFWNPCCKCMFSSIPDHMLVNQIFGFLSVEDMPAVSMVCSRWNFLAHDRSLWSRLHVHVSLDDARVVVEEHPDAEQRTSSCPVLALKEEADAVTSQRKSWNAMNQISMLTQHAAAIRHLRASGGRNWSQSDTPYRDLLPIPFRHVRNLDLSHNTRLDPSVILRLVASQPLVESLDLGRCAQLTDDAFCAIVESAKRVREVSVAHCRLLTDVSIGKMAEVWPPLTMLDLTSCPTVSAVAVGVLLSRRGRQMRVLRVRGLRGLSDQFLADVAKNCPHLCELDVSDSNPFGPPRRDTSGAAGGGGSECDGRFCRDAITDTGVQFLASQCPGLVSLRLHAQRNITDTGLAAALRELPLLRRLDVRNCHVGDAALGALANTAKGLELLQLHRARDVTDVGVGGLRALKRLRRVELSGSKKVTLEGTLAWLRERPVADQTLELWVGGIPSLREMDAPPAVHVRNQ